ncbi:hypothetical protein MHY_26310 [Megamonas hypermegale ART12/1]|nr:hypothetical protein MHY_26310 [Megamonas hypermegale ART12/1]
MFLLILFELILRKELFLMQEVMLKQEEIENIIIDDEKKDEKKTLTKLPEHRCKRCNRLLFMEMLNM